MVQVTDRPTALPKEVGYDSDYTLNAGETLHAAATPSPRFNKDAAWPTSVFTPTAGFMFNLGKQPRRLEYRITPPNDATPNRLMMSETLFGGIAPVEISDGMINLQAEYGIDRNNNQLIDANEWTVTAPDNSVLPGDPNNPCAENPAKSWRCVRAVRVALLARSSHWDQTACTPNPQWTSGAGGALALTNFAMTNVDGTAPSAGRPRVHRDPAQPEQLAALPLQRLRNRDPAPEHDLGDCAMNQARPFALARMQQRRCAPQRSQRGVVIFIALIVLVAMTLAGIAMMRSSGSAMLTAGNLGFRQNATASGDLGLETARTWLSPRARSRSSCAIPPAATTPPGTTRNRSSPARCSIRSSGARPTGTTPAGRCR